MKKYKFTVTTVKVYEKEVEIEAANFNEAVEKLDSEGTEPAMISTSTDKLVWANDTWQNVNYYYEL